MKISSVLLRKLVAGVIFLASCSAIAQTATGTITGTVSDKTGGVVPDAAVVVRDTQTGIVHKATTNSSGGYTVTLLPIGVYEVSAEKQGFKLAKRGNIQLNITDVARADFSLDIGSQTETVTVAASNVALNTENAEISTVVSDRLVADLPLDGRNFQELLLLDGTAYATTGNTDATFRGASVLSDSSTAGVGGSRSSSTGFLIDGLNNRDMGYGSPILVPSIDAVQQFKFQTKTYSAEYGGAANQIQIHFKSGTNAYHGTVYEFVRNNFFDALGYFNKKPGVFEPASLNQNNYGYSFGGPVIIPKLYNGKDKTFFFANYERFNNKSDTPVQNIYVPTAAQWAGQFTKTIKDPYTGIAFPNNQIPANRISQFAKGFQKFVLQPNLTNAVGNYSGTLKSSTSGDQQNYRIDQNFGAKNSAFFRYSTYENNHLNGTLAGTGVYGQYSALTDNHAYQISYTRIFSPRLVNQVTFGYVYADFNLIATTISAADLAGFGVQGGFTDQPTPEVPLVTFSGATPTLSGFGVGSNYPQLDIFKYFNGADSLTYTQGNHTLSAGYSVLNWLHSNGKGANLGTWTFNGAYSGDQFADFLLGNPSVINIVVPSPLAPTAAGAVFSYPEYTYSAYVQDQWKASRRLTLNTGIRYEFFLPVREAEDRYDWFNFSQPGGGLCTANQAAASAVGSNGLLKYCGSSPNGSPKLSFAPRFGFAYLPFQNKETTVIRAGYGLFYDFTDSESDAVNASSNYPFLGQQAFIGTPVTNILSTSMPIPAITTLRPIQLSDLSRAYLGTNAYHRPYTQNWTLSLDHSPARNTTVSLGFQGSTGTHYPTRYSLNQPTLYDPAHPTPITARRPYPNFGEVYPQVYGLSSNYNAGTVKVEHSSHSLVLIAAYVYSKSLDVRSATYTASGSDSSQPEDARNFAADYGQSGFDVKHRAIFSFVYHLPFGRGELFLNHINKTVDAVIGGWQANGIVTLQGGFPFSITATDTGTLIDSPSPRANQVGNPYPAGFKKSAAEWFDINAFAITAPGIPGNSRRNIIRGPGSETFNLSASKSFRLFDNVKFQFRAEAFNALNHTNFNIPGRNRSTAAIGIISSAGLPRRLQFGGKIIF